MSSLLHSQISFPLEPRTSSNKNTTKTRPCIAQLYNKKTHFINLVSKPTFLPNLRKNCSIEKWKARASDNESSDVSPEFLPASPSPVHIVHEFYEAFNKKDTETLKQLLSPKCVYQDLLFYTAYEGQESIIHFLQSAMDAMGPNIHVFVEDVKETNHVMVTVFMHLVWKEKKLPFTSGCRFFTFEEVKGKYFISKITGMEEFPLKPGEFVLKLLKGIGNILDNYPLAAGAMLDSHASRQDGASDKHFDFDFFGPKH
ncbi:uncharacterized protein LOC131622539 [Vicia villosa]|uniref:uncharacterized protein LOC131622539 n=1 Tax=Vicia villosa TaxID=3911 RepID=UPI00273AB659|nr:uncharacterized protein LOC131622539 [Vicia villosa]